jgi:hypothetical protein
MFHATRTKSLDRVSGLRLDAALPQLRDRDGRISPSVTVVPRAEAPFARRFDRWCIGIRDDPPGPADHPA